MMKNAGRDFICCAGGECLLLQKAKRFGDVYRISLRNGFKAQKLAV